MFRELFEKLKSLKGKVNKTVTFQAYHSLNRLEMIVKDVCAKEAPRELLSMMHDQL